MTSLKEIVQAAYEIVYPMPSDETPIKKEAFMVTAKAELAFNYWKISKERKNTEGYFEVDSHLMTTIDLPVVNNKLQLANLPILRSLENDRWLIQLGDFGSCTFTKTSINQIKLYQGNDSLPDNEIVYVIIGNEIRFDREIKQKTLSLTYANEGDDINADVQIDGVLGAIVMRSLLDIYQKKNPTDTTNNSNPNI